MTRTSRRAFDLPLLVASLVFLVSAAAGGAQDKTKEKEEEKPVPTEEVVLGGETFKLELATDKKARTRGLMDRKKIDDRGGMLFVFAAPRRQSFWMKNCLVDIDLLYLDRDGRVTTLHKMKAEPPKHQNESTPAYERRLRRYPSRGRAQFVIELKAGSIALLELEKGQTIELDLPRLKKLAKP